MRHFFLRDETGFPVACVASTLQPDSTVAFAISIYNPSDTFDKAQARRVAEGRLRKGRVILVDAKPIKRSIVDAIANSRVYRDSDGDWDFAPKRVRDAARLWLFTSDAIEKIKLNFDNLDSTSLQKLAANKAAPKIVRQRAKEALASAWREGNAMLQRQAVPPVASEEVPPLPEDARFVTSLDQVFEHHLPPFSALPPANPFGEGTPNTLGASRRQAEANAQRQAEEEASREEPAKFTLPSEMEALTEAVERHVPEPPATFTVEPAPPRPTFRPEIDELGTDVTLNITPGDALKLDSIFSHERETDEGLIDIRTRPEDAETLDRIFGPPHPHDHDNET